MQTSYKSPCFGIKEGNSSTWRHLTWWNNSKSNSWISLWTEAHWISTYCYYQIHFGNFLNEIYFLIISLLSFQINNSILNINRITVDEIQTWPWFRSVPRFEPHSYRKWARAKRQSSLIIRGRVAHLWPNNFGRVVQIWFAGRKSNTHRVSWGKLLWYQETSVVER